MEFLAGKHFFPPSNSLLPSSLGAKLAIAKENDLEVYGTNFVKFFSIWLSEILICNWFAKFLLKLNKPLIIVYNNAVTLETDIAANLHTIAY